MTSEEEFYIFNLYENAIKDILFMYYTMINYNGFFDDFGTEDGTFDPFYFIDCDTDIIEISNGEKNLLHQGSAIKIICRLLQSWTQGDYPKKQSDFTNKVKELINNKKLDHIPDLKEEIKLLLNNNNGDWKKRNILYQKYVKDFFIQLGQ